MKFLLLSAKQVEPTPRYRWRTSVDSVNDGGQTPLACAARQGHADVCRALLEAGADVNHRNESSKQTALLAAVEMKRKHVIEVLLAWSADVQLTDNVGITPLYAAIEGNCVEVVRQLIDAGCDVNVGSQDHAPLFLAARRGFLPLVQVRIMLQFSTSCVYDQILHSFVSLFPINKVRLTGKVYHVLKVVLEFNVNSADLKGNCTAEASMALLIGTGIKT